MSRGPGKMQNALLATIGRHGKPMSFVDIRASIVADIGAERGTKLRTSFERSLRRALHRLAEDHVLIAMGDGGRGDPLRYFFHPLLIGMKGKTAEARALRKALEADPGSEEAAAKFMARSLR